MRTAALARWAGEMVTKLEAGFDVVAACTAPMQVTVDSQQNNNFPAVTRAQTDLLVSALACGMAPGWPATTTRGCTTAATSPGGIS